MSYERNRSQAIVSRSDKEDIINVTAMLAKVWRSARIYAANRTHDASQPPWAACSDYSFVMQQHFEVDCQVPLQHRFQANRIEQQNPESLQQRRDYWGPWLFTQFVYAAIPCLINHPFLLSLRLRQFRYSLPQSFIQQSFEQITRHASWICHFLDILEEKQFAVSDPTLAHCVAIVATIHLQHIFVTDHSLSATARSGFEKCMAFLRRMSPSWRFVDNLVSEKDYTSSARPASCSTSRQD